MPLLSSTTVLSLIDSVVPTENVIRPRSTGLDGRTAGPAAMIDA